MHQWRNAVLQIHCIALALLLRVAPLHLQDKKDALREEQVQAAARITELESLLSTNLLKQQQELAEKLGNADVEADKCAPYSTLER